MKGIANDRQTPTPHQIGRTGFPYPAFRVASSRGIRRVCLMGFPRYSQRQPPQTVAVVQQLGMLGNTERLWLWLVYGFLPVPVDTANQPPCSRPLGSIPLSGTSLLLRANPPLRAAFLLSLSRVFCLSRSVRIGAEGSHVPLNCCATASRHLNAGGHGARNRLRPRSSRVNDSTSVWSSFLRFRHVISGSLAFVSLSPI